MEHESPKMTRRSFLKGVAALGGAAAIPAFMGRSGEPEERISRKNNSESERIQRIEKEVKKAEKLIEAGDPHRFFESSYLIFALYCSDRFLKKIAVGGTDYDSTEQIIRRFSDKITPEIRERYVRALDTMSESIPKAKLSEILLPLERFSYGHGKNHLDAVDLFIKEGAPVKAMSAGVVVAAERIWKKDDLFSVASIKGGNSVIVYNSADAAFYRYCHLESVSVRQGEKITAGTEIGTVGHSGVNASKPGHGGHLHFEMNQYERRSKKVRSLSDEELRRKLELAKRK